MLTIIRERVKVPLINMKKKTIVYFFAVLYTFIGQAFSFSQNQTFLTKYLSRLMDETKIETDIGSLFLGFLENKINLRQYKNQSIENQLHLLANKLKINISQIKYYIVESSIPLDIPLPGGTILLSNGTFQNITNEDQLEFLLARNIYMLYKKIPIKVLKKEGIYPIIIKELKQPKDKRNIEKVRDLFRRYIKAYQNIEHYKIDEDVIKLLEFNKNKVVSVINLLEKLDKELILLSPFEITDLDTRLANIKKILQIMTAN